MLKTDLDFVSEMKIHIWENFWVNRLHPQEFSAPKINPVQCTALENTQSKSIFIDISDPIYTDW